jgi:hypothetical protein
MANVSFFLILFSIISISQSSLLTSIDENYCTANKETILTKPSTQIVVNNLNETFSATLNKNFKENFECLYKVFDQSIVEMNQVYHDLNLNSGESLLSESQNKTTTSKKGDKKKSKKLKLSENFLGQVGFFAYSINLNHTVAEFKHESIKYIKPINETNQASLESAETELFSYRNDMAILKRLLSYLKLQEKIAFKKLKSAVKNEVRHEQDENLDKRHAK